MTNSSGFDTPDEHELLNHPPSGSQPPASLALETQHIPHRVFRHEQPVESLEQAASDRNQEAEQIVRSILFQIRSGEFVMVLVAGPAQVDWKKLRQLVGRSRIRMAAEDEVLEVTGYRVGTVSPFGLKNPVRILIDASVLKEEEISTGSGIRNVAIILKSADLQRALAGAEIVSLTERSQPP
ncbi:MAG TPA: YbaK/EbsC family protein [Anaerolineales bacterium]|nr:YbaK/EbsC family protein [Anaerolineales bacterium]